jgi:hypothetical protein
VGDAARGALQGAAAGGSSTAHSAAPLSAIQLLQARLEAGDDDAGGWGDDDESK